MIITITIIIIIIIARTDIQRVKELNRVKIEKENRLTDNRILGIYANFNYNLY